jgi:hypothetical protein
MELKERELEDALCICYITMGRVARTRLLDFAPKKRYNC